MTKILRSPSVLLDAKRLSSINNLSQLNASVTEMQKNLSETLFRKVKQSQIKTEGTLAMG